MKIVAFTMYALGVVLFAACGGRIEGSGGTSAPGITDPGMPGIEKPNVAMPVPSTMGLDQSQSYCVIDVSKGCPCDSGSVCVSGVTASGTALLGCVPLDMPCEGAPTCACMHCVCDGLGQSCGGVTTDETSGAGLVLNCME